MLILQIANPSYMEVMSCLGGDMSCLSALIFTCNYSRFCTIFALTLDLGTMSMIGDVLAH